MFEKSLDHKLKVFPQFHPEVLTSLINCAHSYSKVSEWDKAIGYFSRAFETSKNLINYSQISNTQPKYIKSDVFFSEK